MEKLKAFFAAFTAALCIMLFCYGGLYWRYSSKWEKQAGGEKHNVPILTAMADDSKNILMIYRAQKADFYFLLQFNAIQDRINVLSLPQNIYMEKVQRTLGESMEYAGVLQCVQDLSAQYELAVDYYLVCGTQQLLQLTQGFEAVKTEGMEIPHYVENYLLKGSDRAEAAALVEAVDICSDVLCCPVGLEFVNLAGYTLLKDNLAAAKSHSLLSIRDDFSALSTNIGTVEAEKLKRILNLLLRSQPQFNRGVAAQETAQQTVDGMFKE